jgi:hypothetical protein
MRVVEPLHHVTVALEAGPGPAGADAAVIAFVYGIAPGGLTAFELLLAGRPAGSAVRFDLAAAEADAFFERLAAAVRPLFRGRPQAAFTARIERIEPAAPREVVRALAATAGHGPCGCGGGCGCGGQAEKPAGPGSDACQ